jgi:hypothetical protein
MAMAFPPVVKIEATRIAVTVGRIRVSLAVCYGKDFAPGRETVAAGV